MKYSEMGAREQAKLLCAIAPKVSKICQDAEFNTKLAQISKKNQECAGKRTVFQTYADMFEACAPLLLDRHYDDVMDIASGLLGKTAEEMERAGILAIIRELKTVADEDLIGFFKQSAVSGMNL